MPKFLIEVETRETSADEFIEGLAAADAHLPEFIGASQVERRTDIKSVARAVAAEAMDCALDVLEQAEDDPTLDAAETARAYINTAYSALRLTGEEL